MPGICIKCGMKSARGGRIIAAMLTAWLPWRVMMGLGRGWAERAAMSILLSHAARLRHILRDARGATMIEYLLLLSLIAAAVIGAFTNLADNAGDMYNMIASTVA